MRSINSFLVIVAIMVLGFTLKRDGCLTYSICPPTGRNATAKFRIDKNAWINMVGVEIRKAASKLGGYTKRRRWVRSGSVIADAGFYADGLAFEGVVAAVTTDSGAASGDSDRAVLAVV